VSRTQIDPSNRPYNLAEKTAAAFSEIQAPAAPLAHIALSAPAVPERMDCTAESLHQPSFENNTTPNPFNHADNIKTKAIMAEAKAWAKNSDINWEDPCCIDLAARIEIIFHRNHQKYAKHAIETNVGLVGLTAVAVASLALPVPGLGLVPLFILAPHEYRWSKIRKLVMWRKSMYEKIKVISDDLNLETPTRLIDIFDSKYGSENVRRYLRVDENRIVNDAATSQVDLYVCENMVLNARSTGEKKNLEII